MNTKKELIDNEEELKLLKIEDLLSRKVDGLDERKKFFVPAYQRGYRWSYDQARQLMDDLIEFQTEAVSDPSAFYCLQPLVTKPVDKEKYPLFANYKEVIDGQQRLTTILLMLQAIHTLMKQKDSYGDDSDITIYNRRYEIKYETRDSSEIWLDKIKAITEENDPDAIHLSDDNCDYSHLVEVYLTIYKRLDEMTSDDLQTFRTLLCKQVVFIPYEPQGGNGSNNDIFDDINAGKIDLNNAELIKALLLKASNIEGHPHEEYRINAIAIEWDAVEKRLQEKEFWGFIFSSSHPFTYDTHIEYLLDLLYDKTSKHADYEQYTFDKVNSEYRSATDKLVFATGTWKKIKNMFDKLEEWFEDRHLYHRIGYLLEFGQNITITQLISSLEGKKKDSQIAELDRLIQESLSSVKGSQLFHSKRELSQVLFLYNTLAEDRRIGSTARFSFADYKNVKHRQNGWDQEHVASATEAKANIDEREKFALEMIEYFTGEETMTPSEAVLAKLSKEELAFVDRLIEAGDLSKPYESEKLKSLFDDLIDYFNSDDDDFDESAEMIEGNPKNEKDFIWNFVLLNAGTNRSYGNALFPVKRKRILKDEFEVYTPVGTRNVFEKAYSRKLVNMLAWTRDDAKAYWEELRSTLNPYITLTFPFKHY